MEGKVGFPQQNSLNHDFFGPNFANTYFTADTFNQIGSMFNRCARYFRFLFSGVELTDVRSVWKTLHWLILSSF